MPFSNSQICSLMLELTVGSSSLLIFKVEQLFFKDFYPNKKFGGSWFHLQQKVLDNRYYPYKGPSALSAPCALDNIRPYFLFNLCLFFLSCWVKLKV